MTSHELSSNNLSLSSDKPTSWLITGGCGFIGRNLIKHLLDKGVKHIRILDNLSTGTRDDLAQVTNFEETTLYSDSFSAPNLSSLSSHLSPSSSFEPNLSPLSSNLSPSSSFEPNLSPLSSHLSLVVGDIRNYNHCLQAAKGCDVIVHLAANTGVPVSIENPRMDCEQNVIGTLNALEAARQANVKRFVFASSNAPIGNCEPPAHEEIAPRPLAPYGASKLAGEGYCSAYYNSFGLETVALRFGNVYGPLSSHKDSVVAKFIKQALEGKTLEIYGDGNQTRDFIYIDDLIMAIYLAATISSTSSPNSNKSTQSHFSDSSTNLSPLISNLLEIGGEVFQISASSETTINELLERMLEVFEEIGIKEIKSKHGSPRHGDIKRNYSDTNKARDRLGWQAEINLKQGLCRTVEWFVKNTSSAFP